MGMLAAVSPMQQVASAQTVAAPPRDSTPGGDPLFKKRDLLMALGFAVGTVAFFPLDRRAATELQDSSTQANRFLKDAATGVELIASPGAYVIGGGLYLVGRLGHHERIADLGWHGTEAVLFAQGVTMILKGTLGRARPFVTNDTNPADFRFGAGFGNGNRSSFPSGHTSTAFAAAAAVTAETGRWWPKSTMIVGPLMYGGASLVGMSRMYHNRHWGSDVMLGAAIGTFSGQKVVQYSHKHPHNLFDRVMLGTKVVPTADGGMEMRVSIPW
jgi:membrane-associated phospholipid phosphatase